MFLQQRQTMRAVPFLMFALSYRMVYVVSTYPGGEESSALSCKSSEQPTGALCSLLHPDAGFVGEASAKKRLGYFLFSLDMACNSAVGCAGPREPQVAAFRAKLSDPTALKTQFSYHSSASLITNGLANGTDPVYVYTTPRCNIQPMTSHAKPVP